jgi:hypothetical protein
MHSRSVQQLRRNYNYDKTKFLPRYGSANLFVSVAVPCHRVRLISREICGRVLPWSGS